jgi:hypothetical protein
LIPYAKSFYSQRDESFALSVEKGGGSGVESVSGLRGARNPSSLEVGFLSASLKDFFTPCQKLLVKISFIAFLVAVDVTLLLQSPLSHDTTGRPWIAPHFRYANLDGGCSTGAENVGLAPLSGHNE